MPESPTPGVNGQGDSSVAKMVVPHGALSISSFEPAARIAGRERQSPRRARSAYSVGTDSSGYPRSPAPALLRPRSWRKRRSKTRKRRRSTSVASRNTKSSNPLLDRDHATHGVRGAALPDP